MVNKVAVNQDKLKAAIADHAQTVSDVKAHRQEITFMQQQLHELNTEITQLNTRLKEISLAADSIDINDIKRFSEMKMKISYEIEALSEVRDDLKKRIPVLERDYSRLDATVENDAKRDCWRVIYEALFESFPIDLLQELIVVGVACGKHESKVIADLNISVDYRRLEALAKQFSIPV